MTPYASVGGKEGFAEDTEFSPYSQELRDWSRGRCMSGCTPVAFATLLEYWDGKKFPKLIGSDTENSHPDHTHSDVRSMIEILRNDMNVSCDSDQLGGVFISKHPNAAKYIKTRGYNSEVANSDYGKASKDAWNDLKNEIDAGRPVVGSIAVNGSRRNSNHTVVVYGYHDAPGQAHDEFYYISGWGTSLSIVGARSDYYTTTKVVIR